MASMDREELLLRLERMIRKAEAKGRPGSGWR